MKNFFQYFLALLVVCFMCVWFDGDEIHEVYYRRKTKLSWPYCIRTIWKICWICTIVEFPYNKVQCGRIWFLCFFRWFKYEKYIIITFTPFFHQLPLYGVKIRDWNAWPWIVWCRPFIHVGRDWNALFLVHCIANKRKRFIAWRVLH